MAGEVYSYRFIYTVSGVVDDPSGPTTSGLDTFTLMIPSGVETHNVQDVTWNASYFWAETFTPYVSGVDGIRHIAQSVIQETLGSGQTLTSYGFESGGKYKDEVLGFTAEQRDFYIGRMRTVFPFLTISGISPDSVMTISGLTEDPIDWQSPYF